MLRTLILSAFGAGLVACLVTTALQSVTTQPLIVQAEVYEEAGGGAPSAHVHETEAATGAAHHRHDAEAWAPADGPERTITTMLANLLVGVGASLMILGLMTAKGQPIDARHGAIWGLCGFVAASLLPSLGLPPELPGTEAAEVTSRQTWWLATAAASGLGLALLVFGSSFAPRAAGVALIVAPHLIGAPEAPTHEAAYPAGMAGQFVAASLVLSAVLWSVSGTVGAWLHGRLARTG